MLYFLGFARDQAAGLAVRGGSFARDQLAGLAVRPLLYTAGAAVAAAGLFHCTRSRGDWNKKVGVVSSNSAMSKDSTSTSGDEENKVGSEKSNLENKVKELEELLSKAQRECSIRTKEFEQEREAHSVLKSQYRQLRQSLQQYDQERERESKDHVDLKENFHQIKETLSHKENLLQNLRVSLNEAERKVERAMESNAELEREIYKLALDMELLQDSTHDMEDELTQAAEESKKDQTALCIMKARFKWIKRNSHRELKRKQHQYKILRMQYRKMIDNLKKRKRLLKDLQMVQTEAEVKYDLLTETNAELRRENSDLISDTGVLQDHVHELEQKLTKMQCENVNLTNDRKQAEKDYGVLQSHHEETLKQLDGFLKEEKYEVLLSQVKTLQDSVQHLEAELHESRTNLVEIKKEKVQDQEVLNFLQLQHREMRNSVTICEEMLKFHDNKVRVNSIPALPSDLPNSSQNTSGRRSLHPEATLLECSSAGPKDLQSLIGV